MGPRPFGRGRVSSPRAALLATPRFNGAATFRSRKARRVRPRAGRVCASMGPRPFGRGRTWPEWCARRLRRRFNGAATFRSRKVHPWPFRQSCATSFNGAATFRSRKVEPADESRRIVLGFNGAATFRSRKAFSARAALNATSASMGPRPFGRGRPVWPAGTIRSLPGFNGAATFRSRKGQHSPSINRTEAPLLQWGRDLSVAEGAQAEHGVRRPVPASMGPRPFGRGRAGVARVSNEEWKLQWGRDLSVAEGAPWVPGYSMWGCASMGPRPFGRGRLEELRSR